MNDAMPILPISQAEPPIGSLLHGVRQMLLQADRQRQATAWSAGSAICCDRARSFQDAPSSIQARRYFDRTQGLI